MSGQQSLYQLSKLYNLISGNWKLILIGIGVAIYFLGDELIDYIMSNEMILVWVVLLILLLMNFEDNY